MEKAPVGFSLLLVGLMFTVGALPGWSPRTARAAEMQLVCDSPILSELELTACIILWTKQLAC
jgi:hypothetical protein